MPAARPSRTRTPAAPASDRDRAWERLQQALPGITAVRWSAARDRVTSFVAQPAPAGGGAGKNAPSAGPPKVAPVTAARAFLQSHGVVLGLRPELGDLTLIREATSLGGAHLEWQQIVAGRRIDNARVNVNLDRDGAVVGLVSSYLPEPGPAPLPKLSKAQVRERALDEYLRRTPSEPVRPPSPGSGKRAQPPAPVRREDLRLSAEPTIEEGLFVVDGHLRATYEVLVLVKSPLGGKRLTIDAETGAILLVRDFVHQAFDGVGQVFIPNPVCSIPDLTLTDGGGAESAVPTNNPNPYFTAPLPALEGPAGGPFTLTGPFCRVADLFSPSNPPPSSPSGSFEFRRGNPSFDDVMVYFHIDRAQRYLQSLGFTNVSNRQLVVDTAGNPGRSNNYNKPPSVPVPAILLSVVGVDGAEDAEIIVHEYGHAMQDDQNGAAYDVFGVSGAMGEGFGDYWAVSNFLAEARASGHPAACFGEWFASSEAPPMPCLRRVDGTLTVTDYDPSGDPHSNGTIWSRTLWDILNLLGKTTADRLVVQSHFNAPASMTWENGADAIMTADLQLFHGSHLPQLCRLFVDRHYFTSAFHCGLPTSAGTQPTLVLLAQFPDTGLPAPPPDLGPIQAKLAAVNAYLAEVANGRVSLDPTILGWFSLPHPRAYYYDQTAHLPLIDLVNDALQAAVSADSSLRPGAYNRLLVITNDDLSGGETRGDRDWATTGLWPYDRLPGAGSARLSASVHRLGEPDARFTHAIGHHFGLVDLYPHEGVTFPRPYVDGWDNMAKTGSGAFNNVHVLGWAKRRAGWLDASDVQFVPRPPPDPDPAHAIDSTYPIGFAEADDAGVEVIQIGTTPGVSNAADEHVSYFVEARRRAAGTFDTALPDDGVLIYYVNEDVAQGFGPARLVDRTPGDGDLTNAAFHDGDTVTNIDGTGLTISVQASTGPEAHRIRVQYDPPETDVDVWIHGRDVNWRSEDIWVDAPAHGCSPPADCFDATAVDHGDAPRPGLENRVYALIHNRGPGTAHNVRVDFWFSDPYHGLDGGEVDPDTGGNIAFNKHQFTVIPDIPPNSDAPAFVMWTPEPPPAGAAHPHACVKVKVATVLNDINELNQASQENIDSYDTTRGSPYAPVVNRFRVVNPFTHPILVYLRADDVPVGWTAEIVPPRAHLLPGASVDAQVTIQAPDDYLVCSTELVKVTGWYPNGDTLVPLGGTTAEVNLKQRTGVSLSAGGQSCQGSPSRDQTRFVAPAAVRDQTCQQIAAQGCTTPPRPYEHLTLEYTGPDGQPVFHDVVTDAHGCFEDFLVGARGGLWTATATYEGGVCTTASESPTISVVLLPPVKPQAGFIPWFSLHLGMGFPLGSFADGWRPGSALIVDLEEPVGERFALELLGGYHQFHAITGPPLAYRSLALDAKLYFPLGIWRGFAAAGPVFHWPDSGATSWGLTASAGLQFPLHTHFSWEIAADLHAIDPTSTSPRLFLDTRTGVVFRF